MSTQPATQPTNSPQIVPPAPKPTPTVDDEPKLSPVEQELAEIRERFTDTNAMCRDHASAIRERTNLIRRNNGVDLPAVSKACVEIEKLADELAKKANAAQTGH